LCFAFQTSFIDPAPDAKKEKHKKETKRNKKGKHKKETERKERMIVLGWRKKEKALHGRTNK
jgi:hypothetical protein